jgi:hypothetical protein
MEKQQKKCERFSNHPFFWKSTGNANFINTTFHFIIILEVVEQLNVSMKQASELLFDGKIPTEFSIAESEVTSVKIPLPYHVCGGVRHQIFCLFRYILPW